MVGISFLKMGDLVATQGHPYLKADSQVQASLCSLPSSLLRTIAGPGSPPWSQHSAVPSSGRGCGCHPGSRPLCAPLTPEEDCGLGLPARFFLEIEGVFISSLFFLENMVEPASEAVGEDRQARGGSALQLLVSAGCLWTTLLRATPSSAVRPT